MAFLISGGSAHQAVSEPVTPLTLGRLRDPYLAAHGNGALEATLLHSIGMHFRHLVKRFGERQGVVQITPCLLQGYLEARCRQKGKRERFLSTTTVAKEIGTLRAVWNWTMRSNALTNPFPNKSLVLPKSEESPHFMTWPEIERKIARGELTAWEVYELWSCLFLTRPEIDELLEFARENSTEPHLYPMLAYAAHTRGAAFGTVAATD